MVLADRRPPVDPVLLVDSAKMVSVELHLYRRTLLELIWDGVAHPEYNKDRPTWRVWDYVARLLEQRHPDIDDALDLWATLQLPPVPIGSGLSAPYGLVWSTNTNGMPPRRDSRVGLTIAGLQALATTSASAARCADNFASVIGAIAHADDRLEPTAETAVDEQVQFELFTEMLRTRTREDMLSVPDDITLLVLQHEPAQIELVGSLGLLNESVTGFRRPDWLPCS